MTGIRGRAAAGAVALLLACAAPTGEDAGDVQLVTGVAALGSGAEIPVNAVWIHLWGSSAKGRALDTWVRATQTGARWQVTIPKVGVGDYLVAGRAYSSSAATFTDVPDFASAADVPVAVVARLTTSVSLVLQQNAALHPPDRLDDNAPIVTSLVVSSSAVDSSPSGVALALSATVTDLDLPADALSFAWDAAYAPPLAAGEIPGAFSTPAQLQTTWTPPAGYEGTVTFTFIASDQRGATSAVSFSLPVSPSFGTGSLEISVDVNNHPDIIQLRATDAQLPPGDSTGFTLVATDPDGDPIDVAWDDGGCGGAFTDPAALATTYVAPEALGACTITAVVTDARGGRNQQSLVIHVSQLTPAYAPAFTFAARSPTGMVAPSSTIVFTVGATEVVGAPPAIPVTRLAWSDGRGGAFTALSSTDPGLVRWTAPACGGATAPLEVLVTVTATGSASAGSLETVFPFPVTVACP